MAGSKTILCIEDDHFISELYSRALLKAGFSVDSAVSGQKGLEMAKTKAYDIILLDIMTPDMTGVEVLHALRDKADLVPNTKILVTTNLDQPDDIKSELEKLADGYLIKAEITPSKLVEIVSSLSSSQLPARAASSIPFKS